MANNANTVAVISGGTTYNFWDGTGAKVAYTGANSPWTSAATSCFSLVYNQTAGPIWAPTPQHATMIYSGDPLFAIGRRPMFESYDNLTETIGVQLYATTKDNAIYLLRLLRQILNTAMHTVPAILSVKGGTNTGYTEIYRADIDESSLYLIEPTGHWRATMTWTRFPHFARIDTGETLINAVSIKNTGTGSPDNIESLGTGAGDLIYDQQPLNVSLTPGSGVFNQVMLAVINARTYTTSGAGTYATTSTTGASAYSLTHTLTACLTNHNLKPRVLVRASAFASIAQIRFKISLGGIYAYTSPWVSAPSTGGVLVDLGPYPIDIIRQRLKGITTPTATVLIETRSTTGASASITVTYTELLLYSTFMKTVIPSVIALTSLAPFQVNSFQEQTGAVCLPYQAPNVITRNGSAIDWIYDYRGTLPLYVPSSSLYVAWLDGSNAHSTSATATLTVTHAPLWASVRGGS